jgi:hypothetical protein
MALKFAVEAVDRCGGCEYLWIAVISIKKTQHSSILVKPQPNIKIRYIRPISTPNATRSRLGH